jgi:hypothetical protein
LRAAGVSATEKLPSSYMEVFTASSDAPNRTAENRQPRTESCRFRDFSATVLGSAPSEVVSHALHVGRCVDAGARLLVGNADMDRLAVPKAA